MGSPKAVGVSFQLIGGHPILDFVNTLDSLYEEFGPSELLNCYADLIRFVAQSELLSSRQLKDLRQSKNPRKEDEVFQSCLRLRESVAECLYSKMDGRLPKSTSLATLEDFYRQTRLNQFAVWKNGHLDWAWPGSSPVDLPLWILTLIAWELLESPLVRHVKSCGNPTCRWLFLDTSKNHTRRWCDMRVCGNRMKGERFRSQRRSAS
jgi:predicted RNA-binding Zn ribbon-like protein